MNAKECLCKVEKFRKRNPLVFFELLLNDVFAQEYRNLGIYWEHAVEDEGDCYRSVNKHQKLSELTPSDCSLGEAQKEACKFFRRIERKLGFAQLTSQLRQHFGIDLVSRVCIARDGVTEYSDFAIFENNIVPVNTSNLFLAMINDSGKWNFSLKGCALQVRLKCGDFVFAPKEIVFDTTELALKLLDSEPTWWLYSAEDGEDIIAKRNLMAEELEKMNMTNMKMLSTKKATPVMSSTMSIEEEIERMQRVLK